MLALLARSENLAASTLTAIVPVAFGVGVTTRVATVPLTIVKVPLLPPVTVTSASEKLEPTLSLNVNVKVTAPVAVAPAALLVMATVGATLSGAAGAGVRGVAPGGSESPPPQAATRTAAAINRAN